MAATLDDVLNEMRAMVNLGQVQNTIQTANQTLLTNIQGALTRGGRGGASGGPQGGGGWSFWKNTMAGRAFGQTSLGGAIQNAYSGNQQRIANVLGGGQANAASGTGKAAGQAAGAAGGGGAGTLGSLASMAGKAAGVVGVVTTVGSALNEFRKQIENSTTAQFAYYRQLAEVSGGMAQVMAQRDLNDVLRAQRTGDAQSESAGRLEQAENRRKSAAEPLANAFENAKNEVLIQLNGALQNIYALVLDIVNFIRRQNKQPELKRPEDDATGAFGDAVLGLVALAEKAERDAKNAMAGARARGGLSGAMRPGRLP